MTDYNMKQVLDVLRGIDQSLAMIAHELTRIADGSNGEAAVRDLYRRNGGADS